MINPAWHGNRGELDRIAKITKMMEDHESAASAFSTRSAQVAQLIPYCSNTRKVTRRPVHSSVTLRRAAIGIEFAQLSDFGSARVGSAGFPGAPPKTRGPLLAFAVMRPRWLYVVLTVPLLP